MLLHWPAPCTPARSPATSRSALILPRKHRRTPHPHTATHAHVSAPLIHRPACPPATSCPALILAHDSITATLRNPKNTHPPTHLPPAAQLVVERPSVLPAVPLQLVHKARPRGRRAALRRRAGPPHVIARGQVIPARLPPLKLCACTRSSKRVGQWKRRGEWVAGRRPAARGCCYPSLGWRGGGLLNSQIPASLLPRPAQRGVQLWHPEQPLPAGPRPQSQRSTAGTTRLHPCPPAPAAA